MARIFTALTSPADSSSAFLREAGAGAKTIMDAQRQQEKDAREQERYEAGERMAVEAHKIGMEQGRLRIAATESANEMAELKNQAMLESARSATSEAQNRNGVVDVYINKGHLPKGWGGDVNALLARRAAAVANGEPTEHFDLAILGRQEELNNEFAEATALWDSGALKEKLTAFATLGDGSVPEEFRQWLESADDDDMGEELARQEATQNDAARISSLVGSFQQWGGGLRTNAVDLEAQGHIDAFLRDLEGDPGRHVVTAEDHFAYYKRMAWELDKKLWEPWKTAMLDEENRSFREDADEHEAAIEQQQTRANMLENRLRGLEALISREEGGSQRLLDMQRQLDVDVEVEWRDDDTRPITEEEAAEVETATVAPTVDPATEALEAAALAEAVGGIGVGAPGVGIGPEGWVPLDEEIAALPGETPPVEDEGPSQSQFVGGRETWEPPVMAGYSGLPAGETPSPGVDMGGVLERLDEVRPGGGDGTEPAVGRKWDTGRLGRSGREKRKQVAELFVGLTHDADGKLRERNFSDFDGVSSEDLYKDMIGMLRNDIRTNGKVTKSSRFRRAANGIQAVLKSRSTFGSEAWRKFSMTSAMREARKGR